MQHVEVHLQRQSVDIQHLVDAVNPQLHIITPGFEAFDNADKVVNIIENLKTMLQDSTHPWAHKGDSGFCRLVLNRVVLPVIQSIG